MRRLLPLLFVAPLFACASSSPRTAPTAPPPYYGQQQYPQQQYPQQQYPQQQYPQQQFPQQQYPQQQFPQQQFPQQQFPQQPAPQQPVQQPTAQTRPLLAPLVGPVAWQQEVRNVLTELMANLSASNQAKVRGIPLEFDPDPFEINAYAGCDEKGRPFLAATEGLLEAIDAVAQTRASDDLFGTRAYEQYSSTVIPRLAASDKASAALPLGIIPANVVADARRLSRAHEWFDDLVAFTFGHELAHHYLGHTLCANGQSIDNMPAILVVPQLFARAVPSFNQANEGFADAQGTVNVLDTGRARAATAFRWSEKGGLALLDFFSRMERAAGPQNPFIGILRSHPNPTLRIFGVDTVAKGWYLQHPG